MEGKKMDQVVDGAAPAQQGSAAAQGRVEVPFLIRYGRVEVEGIAIFPHEDCEDWEVDVYYYHPETGQRVEFLEQAHYGWSYQDDSLEEEWKKLEELHQNDDMFLERIWDGHDEESPVVVDYSPECSGEWVDIEWPSGEPLRLCIPEDILREMKKSFHKAHPDDDFDLDYMSVSVEMWSGVQKQVKIYYDEEWEYYLPFEIRGDHAVAVDRIIS